MTRLKILLKENFYIYYILKFFYSKLKYLDIHLFILYNYLSIKKNKSETNKNILFSTSMGGDTASVKLESSLALSLKKNFTPKFLLCDKALPACQLDIYTFDKKNPYWLLNNFKKSMNCALCYKPAKNILSKIGKVFLVSDFYNPNELINLDNDNLNANNINIKKLQKTKYKGIAVGEHAYAGTLRYLTVGELSNSKKDKEIFLKFFNASVIFTNSLINLLKKNKIDIIICNHGIYVPHGLTVQVAKLYNIKVFAWNLAYRSGCFIFSKNDTYHHTLIDDPYKWDQISLDNDKTDKIKKYLLSRKTGELDWLTFQKRKNKNEIAISELNKLKKDYKFVVTLLTNVVWDAQVHYPQNAFKSILDWLYTTIEFFSNQTDTLLLIRIHPAEARGVIPARQKAYDEIIKKFKKIPQNIKIFQPEDRVLSYDCIDISNVCIIYGTKMGVEIAPKNIPIIVAGEAWIKNKGMTYDPLNKDEYISLLKNIKNLKPKLNQDIKGLKYAYYFFFIKSINLSYFKYIRDYPPFRYKIFNKYINFIKDKGVNKIYKYFIS